MKYERIKLLHSVAALILGICMLVPIACAYADTGLIGTIVSGLEDKLNWNLRGYLTWGMPAEAVENGLRTEKRDGVAMCENIEVVKAGNSTVSRIYAKAVVGDYTPLMTCYVSTLWGLYDIWYQFAYDKMSDDDLFSMYDKLEKTINYCYGMGERIIDKWGTRGELDDLHYIMRTKWTRGDTDIYLHCLKQDGMYSVALEYQSPKYSDYSDVLEQELEVTGFNMFYGF